MSHDLHALPLTRAAALERLQAFLPHAGEAYARRRNFVAPPGGRDAVSRLSAALRRRLIAEDEVIAAVLDAHGAQAGASFIGEVFWRTYWKGWLEARPSVWRNYLGAVAAIEDTPLLKAARSGCTGIDAYDAWHRELVETGWLHNWARMQFASIWVHTLGLPWEAGAALMAQHLVDADPASNTLSWRWVAGLHTAGKAYLADGARIAAMTEGRFAPQGLATKARIQDVPVHPAPIPPRAPRAWRRDVPSVLMLTPEDCSMERGVSPGLVVTQVLCPETLFTTDADRIAGQDTLDRAAAHWGCPAQWVGDLDAVASHAQQQVITAYAPVGPVATALADWADRLPPATTLGEIRRDWDDAVWPHCRKGYFALRQAIPALIAARFGNQARGEADL